MPTNPKTVLRTYLRVQEQADREIYLMLRRSSSEIDKTIKEIVGDGIGAQVRRDQLMIAKREIETQISDILSGVGRTVEAGKHRAAAAAIDAGLIYERVIAQQNHIPAEWLKMYRDGAVATARKGVDAAIERLLGSSYVPLSQQVYRTEAWTSGLIDRFVDQSLASGLSAREFAKRVKDMIRPDVPGGVSYAAMRLARTEINNAFHATQVQRAKDSEWIEAVKWNTSGSHPEEDECDEYAAHELEGFDEPGLYLPNAVPVKPHPQCLCYMTYEVMDEDEFIDQMLKEYGPEPTGKQYGDWDGTTDGLFVQTAIEANSKQDVALRRYKSYAYEDINGALRGNSPMTDKTREWVKNIDAAMKHTVTARDLKVYRGQGHTEFMRHFGLIPNGAPPGFAEKFLSGESGHSYPGDFDVSTLIGKTWTQPGYLSTRLDEHGAFSDMPIQFRVQVPRGSNGHWYGDNRIYNDEKEFLLPRGQQYTIVGAELEGTGLTAKWWIDILLTGDAG